jgi:cytochrome P450
MLADTADTTATPLTYALRALGRHPELQDQVAAEVTALGDRSLTPDDVPARVHRPGAA